MTYIFLGINNIYFSLYCPFTYNVWKSIKKNYQAHEKTKKYDQLSKEGKKINRGRLKDGIDIE